MKLNDLEVYKLAKEIAGNAWNIFNQLDREIKRIIGEQFIRSADSIAANIAEGFGRFHYADRNKFNYNARGSLIETRHWLEMLKERKMISESEFSMLDKKLAKLSIKLNNYISKTREINRNK